VKIFFQLKLNLLIFLFHELITQIQQNKKQNLRRINIHEESVLMTSCSILSKFVNLFAQKRTKMIARSESRENVIGELEDSVVRVVCVESVEKNVELVSVSI